MFADHAPAPVVFRASFCAALVAAALLAACGSGGNATIGGTVTGLAAGESLTLQDNNADNLAISRDQGFMFPTSVPPGGVFSVTVLTQPAGETCVVANGTGTVDTQSDDVTDVVVTCALSSSVGGTVSGLAVGDSVWLASNGQQLAIASNGTFAFPGVLPAGASYGVTIAAQPAQQTCTIANGSGMVVAGVMANVTVMCQ
jgi:hypothetical protein